MLISCVQPRLTITPGVVLECSYGGETLGGLREVAEQRKLCGVIKVLKVPERQTDRGKTELNIILSMNAYMFWYVCICTPHLMIRAHTL